MTYRTRHSCSRFLPQLTAITLVEHTKKATSSGNQLWSRNLSEAPISNRAQLRSALTRDSSPFFLFRWRRSNTWVARLKRGTKTRTKTLGSTSLFRRQATCTQDIRGSGTFGIIRVKYFPRSLSLFLFL